MLRRLPASLPLLIGVLAWAAGTLLLGLNMLLPALGHGPVKLSPPLVGVTQPDKAVASWPAVLNGTFQASYARLIGTGVPLYADAVRLRNQIEFSVFGVSAIPTLIVGTERRLFEVGYSTEYCARDLAAWRPVAARWAGQVRQMQDDVERRGKVFLYVLTPSKVAQYPDILPPGYGCPASAADRTGIVPAWLAALQAAGVHEVDTTAVLSAAHGAFPFKMYPSGGAHWNDVGGALAEQAVMRSLNSLDPAGGFKPFTFTFHMIQRAVGVDVDIANLMNLMRRFPGLPVPVVDLAPAPAPVPCPGTKVVIVGGSFSHAALEYLARATCNPSPIEYEYWRAYRLAWSRGSFELQVGVDPAQREADILAADVVIYEENEQVLPDPAHGRAFLDFLQQHAG